MIPSQTTRIRHLLGKAIVTSVVALMMVTVTYEGHVGRTLGTEEGKNDLTLGTVYAQESEGPDIGAGLDIVGGLSSFLYYAFDKSYIDKFYGGNVGGFILNFLLSGGDTEGVELDYIINQLTVLKQKLNHVIKLEAQIEKEIQALAEQLSFDTNQIEQMIDEGEMAPAIRGITQYAGSGLLTNYLNSPITSITETDKQHIISTCDSPILHPSKTTGGPVGAWLTTIDDYMTGSSGLIPLLASQVQITIKGGHDAYSAYQVMEGYFLKLILIQAKGINLYINCAHTMSPLAPLSTEIQTNYIAYLTNIVNQFQAFRTAVEETVTINTNYTLIRGAYNPDNGSSSGMVAGGMNTSTGNILPRVDFVIDRALGSSDLGQLLTNLNNGSTEFLKNPRGTLTARVLTYGSDITGMPLTFAYNGPGADPQPPPIAACPESVQRTAVWKLVNATPNQLIISSLAGWLRKGPGQWEKFPAKPNAYLGTPSYQLAVSDIILNPGKMGSIGLCASAFGAKEKDGSLYLEYQMLSSNTEKPGPAQLIGWSGTGTHVTSKGPFAVNADAHLIEIQGTPYTSASTSADQLSGLPYLTWEETSTASIITGQTSAPDNYQMLRYTFSQVPIGSYVVTTSAKKPLTPQNGLYVFMRNRNFKIIQPFPYETQNQLLATSQHLDLWEIFVFENYQLRGSEAVGKLKAANGKYLVVTKDEQGHDTLAFNSDIGQDVTFVGWNPKQGDGIINWGYLEIDGKRVQIQVNSTTQQPAVTLMIPPTQANEAQGTKFKITFIDKGKKALVEGNSYPVSLAYGLPDIDSQMACPALLNKPIACARGKNPIPDNCKCYQYYLFANIGYPYGYFTNSPIAAAGGFGKGLAPEGLGVSPFTQWKNTTSTWVPKGETNLARPSAGDPRGPYIWAEISAMGGSSAQYTAKSAAYRETTLQLGRNVQCTYSFRLRLQPSKPVTFGQWDMEVKNDDKNLNYADIALHWFRTKDDGGRKEVAEAENSWKKEAKMKPYSLNVEYAKLSDGDSDNTATIRYSATLSYDDVNYLGPDTPFMKIGINPIVAFDLTKISCPQP
ncbi:MAG: hypothetical protein KC588_04395 [Nitrospira sp.]|nr:hypothetical protein [Nitrospira sp.]